MQTKMNPLSPRMLCAKLVKLETGDQKFKLLLKRCIEMFYKQNIFKLYNCY